MSPSRAFGTVGTPVTLALLLLGSGSAALAQQPPGPPPAPVRVTPAVAQPMASTAMAPGTVVSRNDAAIAAEVAGRLTWVADIGETVEANEVIARIEDHTLQLQLKENEATVRRLEASLKFLEKQADRQTQLASQNIAARNALDESEADRDMTKQDLVQAKVARDQTLYRIEQSQIRAPFAGAIVERFREAGEYIAVGGEVVRLVNTRDVEVRAQAPVTSAHLIRQGMQVTVEDSGRVALARIRAVIPVGDERSRMIEVRVSLEEPWVIGAPVRVALPQGDPVNVVAVPRDALILRQGSTYLYKLSDDNTAEKVVVTPGVGQGDLIEVRGDIRPGDMVVVRGGERLRAGQPVVVADDRSTLADSKGRDGREI